MRQRRKTAAKYQTTAAWQSGPCIAGWRRLPGSARSPVARGAGEEEEGGAEAHQCRWRPCPAAAASGTQRCQSGSSSAGLCCPSPSVCPGSRWRGRTHREREGRRGKSQVRGLGSGSGRGRWRPGSWLAGSLVLLQGGGATAPVQLVAGGGLGLRPLGNKRRWRSQPKKGGKAPVHP